MGSVFEWIESTRLASTIGGSVQLTAVLSATHLLGFTLVTGGALVANLRAAGLLFPGRSLAEIVRPAGRGIAVGLTVSVLTGLLSAAPRAVAVSGNGTFQLKMALLVAAALFQFTLHRRIRRAAPASLVRAAGAIGLSLWLALAVTACAFILLE